MMGEKRKKQLAAAGLLLALGLGAVLLCTLGRPVARFAADPYRFRSWVEQRGIWGQLAYVLLVFLQVVLAFFPGEALEIAGGYAFGAVEGSLLCLLGASAASMVVFWLVRRFGVGLAALFFGREKLESLSFLRTTPRRSRLLTLIFVMPGTPKDLLYYYAGLTDLSFSRWAVISSLGRLPSIVTSAVGGSALGSGSYYAAAAVFAVTLGVSCTGMAFYERFQKSKEKQRKNEENGEKEPDRTE